MIPLPSPPFIALPNVLNFRSLHLTPTSPPLFYRSASLSRITPSAIQTLHSLHITTIYDLRSHPEVQKPGELVQIEHIHRIHAPVFSEIDYSPEAIAIRFSNYASDDGTAGFVKAYADILESGGPALRRVFEFLLGRGNSEGEKCLVHCTAGKDRTGLLCALVLMLGDRSDEEVAEEYALTELGLAEAKEELVERLMKVEALRGDRVGIERMIGARRESMLAAIGMIRERYRGAEGYLRGKCGFGDEEVRVLKEKIMEGG